MERTAQACPDCGADTSADTRFVMWCAACDWNVDPGGPEPSWSRLDRLRRELARRHGERLLREVTAGGPPRGRRDAASIAAYGIALAVHAVTAVLVVGGVLLVVGGWGSVPPVAVGVFLLALAWTLRPRLGGLPDDVPVLYRKDAPRLYALIDEVAEAAGTRGVDAVVVGTEVNAGVTTYGLRRRRVLTLGLGLWEPATGQERVALLGHELGHYAHGDVRHGAVVGGALRSLAAWHYLVEPVLHPSPLEAVLNVLYIGPRAVILGTHMLLEHLTLRAAQRGEYLADALSARVGSTEAAVGVLDLCLVASAAESFLLRERNARQVVRAGRTAAPAEPAARVWTRLAEYVASIPESEYERQRRVAALRGHSVDTTHPPTHLRRIHLLTATPSPATITPSAAVHEEITRELAPARESLAQALLRGSL
ncbi:M48 family metallopeptidase [Streptomyces fradiae]|uniref:M48 family metallopeptidase n=1 Tax=Streptomyces fradiae TaxID=1906 RepID=UPI0036BBE1E8